MKNLPVDSSKHNACVFKKKAILRLLSFICLIAILYGLFLTSNKSFAATNYVNVSGKIGEYYLNVSGFISPYASIVMTSDGNFIRATVADKNGFFSFIDILIKKGFSNFCLTAIDFKKLGESHTCFNFSPAEGNVTKENIFLPPTLGLSRTEISENSEVLAFGYTMPGATVTIHLSNGKVITVTADEEGYYEVKIKGLKAGKYELYATARYEEKESLKPTKTLQLRSMSWWELIIAFLQELWKKFIGLLTSFYLNPLWLILPILILIIILILKLWPEKFTFIYNSKLMAVLPGRKKKKLHHDWWIGY